MRARLRLVLLGGSAVGAGSFGGIDAYRAGFVDAIYDAMAGLDMLWHPSGAEGLGTAVIEGFAAATAPIVGVIDADMSHPPGLLPRMFAAMQAASADLVVGSRYIPGGGTRNWGIGRRLMSRVACMMARGLTPIRDATSGLFLIRRELANGVRISAGDEGGVMAKGLESKVGGLLGNLLNDIAKASSKLLDESLKNRDGVTRKAFRPLLAMADKLDGFNFVDPRVGALASMIRHVLSVMPPEGRIEGADLRNLYGLTSMLSSPDQALVIGTKVTESDVSMVYDEAFGQPYKAVAPKALPVPVTAQPMIKVPGLFDASQGAQQPRGPAFQPVAYTPPPAANFFNF